MSLLLLSLFLSGCYPPVTQNPSKTPSQPTRKMLQTTIVFPTSSYPVKPFTYTTTSSHRILYPRPLCYFSAHLHYNHKHYLGQQWRLKQPKKKGQLKASSATYEVGGGYPDEELDVEDRTKVPREQQTEKLDPSHYDALLKGGEQVTSVLEEMITLVSFLLSHSFTFWLVSLLGKWRK